MQGSAPAWGSFKLKAAKSVHGIEDSTTYASTQRLSIFASATAVQSYLVAVMVPLGLADATAISVKKVPFEDDRSSTFGHVWEISFADLGDLEFELAVEEMNLLGIGDAPATSLNLFGLYKQVDVLGSYPSSVNALNNLVWMPPADWNSFSDGRASLQLSVTDASNNVAQGSFRIHVTAVNDQPSFTFFGQVAGSQDKNKFLEDTPTPLESLALIISDADLGEELDAALTVTLSSLHGTVRVPSPLPTTLFMDWQTLEDGSLALEGAPAMINAAMQYVYYESDKNWNSVEGSEDFQEEVQMIRVNTKPAWHVQTVSVQFPSPQPGETLTAAGGHFQLSLDLSGVASLADHADLATDGSAVTSNIPFNVQPYSDDHFTGESM